MKMVRHRPWSIPFPGPLCQNGALDFVKRHMRSSLACYLFLNPSFTDGHLLRPSPPNPPRIVLPTRISQFDRQEQHSGGPAWGERLIGILLRLLFYPLPMPLSVVRANWLHTRFPSSYVVTINHFLLHNAGILLIQNQAKALQQHPTCQCLWRIWTRPSVGLGKRSILFCWLPCIIWSSCLTISIPLKYIFRP